MKKSLLLSIVMTLVLVVAMSTATFAWYTANANATATSASITATTSSSNLQIATTGEYSNTVELGAFADEVPPMMPTAQDLSAWTTAEQTIATDPVVTYSTATPASWNFKLSNVGATTGVTLVFSIVPASQTDETSGLLRWAVVQGDKVVGAHADAKVLTKSTKLAEGSDTLVVKSGETTAALATESYVLTAGASDVAFTLYVWFEGQTMTNALAGSDGEISLNIAGTPVGA